MDHSWANRLRIQCVYFCIGLLVLFLQTLPIERSVLNYAAPDVMFAFSCALIIRRPDAMTPLLIVVTTLLADFILMRPPALWTLLVLASALVLKTRIGLLRDNFFTMEWGAANLVMSFAFITYFFALWAFFLPPQGFTLSLIQMVMTLLFYPVAAYFSIKLTTRSKNTPKDKKVMGSRS